MPGFKAPRILGTIAEDATRYFLVIFTSHFVLTMSLILGRVSRARWALWNTTNDT